MSSPSSVPAGDDQAAQAKAPSGRSPEVPPWQQTVVTTALQSVATTLATLAVNDFWTGFHTFLEKLPVPLFVSVPAIGVLGGLLLQGWRPAGVLAGTLRWLGPLTSKIRHWLLAPLSQHARMVTALRALRRAFPVLAITFRSVVSGVVVVLAGWGAAQGVSALVPLAVPAPCAAPQELSVITAPENVDGLRMAADAYVKAQTDSHGCPPYRISVAPAPSLLQMASGFAFGWCRNDESVPRLFGRRPDAWIATSSGEVEYVKKLRDDERQLKEATYPKGHPCHGRAELKIVRSVADDQMVIAMLDKRSEDLKKSPSVRTGDEKSLADIVRGVRTDLRMRLVYPQPGLSSAGLTAAAGLVKLEHREDTLNSIVSDESVNALLCRFHQMTKRQKGDVPSCGVTPSC